MKHNFIYFFIIICFFSLLIFPETVFCGASSGLLLWFNIILPTLLPFLIFSGLLINTSAIHILAQVTYPLFHLLFGVTKYGSFAVLCGFLCGYPMGAKITSDLLSAGKISFSEAKYLLSFCNNTSPMFLISYVLHQNFHSPQLIFPAICIQFLSPLICSFFFRKFYKLTEFKSAFSFHLSSSKTPSGNLIDECIMKSFETITKIGGYIILFSIMTSLLSSLSVKHLIFHPVFLSFFEITNGISRICNSMLSFQVKFIASMALVSFGGWCSIAQTHCMINETGIPLLPYITEKLITTLVTSLFAFIYIMFF